MHTYIQSGIAYHGYNICDIDGIRCFVHEYDQRSLGIESERIKVIDKLEGEGELIYRHFTLNLRKENDGRDVMVYVSAREDALKLAKYISNKYTAVRIENRARFIAVVENGVLVSSTPIDEFYIDLPPEDIQAANIF